MKRYRSLRVICPAFLCAALIIALLPPFADGGVPVWASARHSVVLDAGHGGMDGGAVGAAGTLEKDLNLDIAMKCELLMGLFGLDVIMTRREDRSIDDGSGATIARRKADDIRARVEIANAGAEALVSIHMNAFPDPKYWGAQTFYSKNTALSADLAASLQNAARTLLAPGNAREIKAAEDGIYLLRHVRVPAVIIECGFLSNAEEEARLASEEYRKAVAAAICAGTLRYFHSQSSTGRNV